jgi:hypothetical protein
MAADSIIGDGSPKSPPKPESMGTLSEMQCELTIAGFTQNAKLIFQKSLHSEIHLM